MSYQTVIDDGTERLEKSLAHLKDQLRGIRTGRATTALVDNVRVEYYGTPTPLSQLASVSIPEPRQLVIKPFDASVLKEIEKAVGKADLGCLPQNDGTVIRLTLPALSGDQRKKYASKVKDMCEETRVSMRNTRRELNKTSDAMQKASDLTEDDNRKLHGDIQDLLKTYEKKVDAVMAKKVEEITEV